MTKSTIHTRLPFPVAIHARAHGYISLAIQPLSLGHLPVAIFAPGGFLDMRAVTEIDVLGNAVDADPTQLAASFCRSGDSLDVRAIGLHGRMAFEANRWLRDTHGLAGVRVGVALFAFELQNAGMPLMAEGDGLFRALERLRETDDQREEKEEGLHVRLIIAPGCVFDRESRRRGVG